GIRDKLVTGVQTCALPISSVALHDYVRDLRAAGRTVLLTTHDLAEADELADRVLLVARGRVVQDASPAQLKRSARSAGSWIRFQIGRASCRERVERSVVAE